MKPVFAQRLNGLRRERKLSQKQTADDLGVSQALLSHYENGVREPKLEFILKACDYYGVSTDYMFGRTNKKKSEWAEIMRSENAEMLRCIHAASFLIALLSEINDEQLNLAVTKYLSYSVCFVLKTLATPATPYEPLFDAACKLAEANLRKTAEARNAQTPQQDLTLDVQALKAKYPDQYQKLTELDDLINKAMTEISNIT